MFAVRATAAGNTTTFWGTTAPAGAAASGLIGAAVGYLGTGRAMSAYVFPRPVAVSKAPQTAASTRPAVVFFEDLIPAPPKWVAAWAIERGRLPGSLPRRGLRRRDYRFVMT